MNPAFDFLREHKDVSHETETLVMKKTGGKLNPNELLQAFENGISGKYGKVYSADPQTLIGWVDQFLNEKNSAKNYLDSPLLPTYISGNESIDWMKETNKCYNAFLRGVSEDKFHHCIYDRMMLDGKIKLNAYTKYYRIPETTQFENSQQWCEMMEKVNQAKRKIIKDTFLSFRARGFQNVYSI